MTLPVANWEIPDGNVKLYHDLQDTRLLHYGPNVTWGELTRQELGTRFTLVKGEIDFGYTVEQLNALQNAHAGFRLAPLIAQDVLNGAAPVDPINAPHSLKLSLIPSIPFPKLSFNLTVSHDDPQYQLLIAQVQRRWDDKTFFSGSIDFSYGMRTAVCSYSVSLVTAEVAKELGKVLRGKKWPPLPLSQDVLAVVGKNSTNWISSLVPAGFPNAFGDETIISAVDHIMKTFFQSTDPIVTFDNGEKIEAVEMVVPSTLVPRQSWTLNKSADCTKIVRALNA